MKRVYLVRHGESEGNERNKVGGKDLALSAAGRMQAAQLAERVQNLEIDKLVVSDFVRAQETIAPTASLKKLEPEIVPAFGEIIEASKLWGKQEDAPEVLAYREDRNTNVANPDWEHEDGESFSNFYQRISEARAYLENVTEESILVVSHNFFIRNFLQRYCYIHTHRHTSPLL